MSQGRKPKLELVDKPERENGSDDSILDPPAALSFEAKLEWMQIAPVLYKQGRLNVSIIGMLENYCMSQGRVREYEAMLQTDGLIFGGRPHPALALQRYALNEARLLAAELQLTRGAAKEEAEQESERKNGWDGELLA